VRVSANSVWTRTTWKVLFRCIVSVNKHLLIPPTVTCSLSSQLHTLVVLSLLALATQSQCRQKQNMPLCFECTWLADFSCSCPAKLCNCISPTAPHVQHFYSSLEAWRLDGACIISVLQQVFMPAQCVQSAIAPLQIRSVTTS
jgi:hypothetical protein